MRVPELVPALSGQALATHFNHREATETPMNVIAEGLRFPEGPIALLDGDVLLVEIEAGRLTRVHPDGSKSVVAVPGGGPNGAAIGPDGACYVCNNGGLAFVERGDRLFPHGQPDHYSGGRIERIDLSNGDIQTLYTECNGHPLRGPNDLVFDASGGFWFTDHGKYRERDRDVTGVYYAQPDGSSITEVIFPVEDPNGVGLSPDEKELYVAETRTGRVWAYPLSGPGQVDFDRQPIHGAKGRLLAGLAGYQLLDSLAVDGAGNVCVATLVNGGITVISPDGASVEHLPMPDRITTNICFGGPSLETAYITLSSLGQLISMPWPRPGLALNFL